MKHLPKALFVVDGISESIAISEARNLNIPTFGIIDSNLREFVTDSSICVTDSKKSIQGLRHPGPFSPSDKN